MSLAPKAMSVEINKVTLTVRGDQSGSETHDQPVLDENESVRDIDASVTTNTGRAADAYAFRAGLEK